jgi:hypothetical protein
VRPRTTRIQNDPKGGGGEKKIFYLYSEVPTRKDWGGMIRIHLVFEHIRFSYF